MKLFPTSRQWKTWSLPSKLTAIGVYAGILGVVLAIAFWVLPDPNTLDTVRVNVIVLHIADLQERPVPGVKIAIAGDGGTGTSDPNGKTRIRLASGTRAGAWVTLSIVSTPPGQDWVFVDPWNSRISVLPFENESDNFRAVYLARRGDREMLRSGKVLESITLMRLFQGSPTT